MEFTRSKVKLFDFTFLMKFQANWAASQPMSFLLEKEIYGLFGNGTRDYHRLSLSLYHWVKRLDHGRSLSIGKRKFFWTSSVIIVNVHEKFRK